MGFQVVTPCFLEWAYYKWGVPGVKNCNPTVIRDYLGGGNSNIFWNVHPENYLWKMFFTHFDFFAYFFSDVRGEINHLPQLYNPMGQIPGFF